MEEAVALPIPSFYQGMPYTEGRRKMRELGWQTPVVNYSETCSPGVLDEICQAYPEVDNCSGTGMGFCSFTFRDSNNNCFRIITLGRGLTAKDPQPLEIFSWSNIPKCDGY
ncbi:MAG: hypothetical protein Cpurp_07560 [Chlorogloea purpurea SAG 13.99]|nr:hypothetical protein [Chlorogloea purpurea SAG 13.99]